MGKSPIRLKSVKRKIKVTKSRKEPQPELNNDENKNESVEDKNVTRYFCDKSEKAVGTSKVRLPNVAEECSSKTIDNPNNIENTNDDEKLIVKRKPKLGPLPSFIPIG